jgi:hypothetical protein
MPAIEVHGLRETLAELRKYEPELFKEMRSDLMTSSGPLTSAVGSNFPALPLKNWHTSGGRRGEKRMPPYNRSSAVKGIKPVLITGGRRNGILRIEQKDAGGQVYDSAGGRSSDSRFVKNLDKRSLIKSNPPRSRSRVMYSSVAEHMNLVEYNINRIIKKVDQRIQTRIVNF